MSRDNTGELRGCSLDKLTGADLRKIHPLFGDDAASSGVQIIIYIYIYIYARVVKYI